MFVFYEKTIVKNFSKKEYMRDIHTGDLVSCASFISEKIRETPIEFVKLGLGETDLIFETILMHDDSKFEATVLEYYKEENDIVLTVLLNDSK